MVEGLLPIGNNMSFIKRRSEHESLKIMYAVARTCRKNGGPLTEQLYCLFRDRRFRDLVEFSFDYSWHFSTDDFLYARQIQALVAKQDFLNMGVDKEAAAFEKFLQSESMCAEANKRFDNLASFDKDVSVVLHYASRKIAKIIGACPSISDLHMFFGPGATTSTKGLEANHRVKLSSRLECSHTLLPAVSELLSEFPHLCDIHSSSQGNTLQGISVACVPGKLMFVPKTSLTHRSIVVEPVLNGLLQNGIGTVIKDRLRSSVGLDLSDQTRNKDLARIGSVDGSLATVDLSMASDTICRGIVWSLLPYEWACLLDTARSPVVTYKGANIILEKFSSMGNAYTFELETLIFYALSYACCKHVGCSVENLRVYGDDIIIPVAAYDLLFRTLHECGFSVNTKKSFSSGPFRESCGADYLRGIDIRPFYLKTKIDDRTLYVMHNWFFRNCERDLATTVFHFTLPHLRLFGPDGYGDGHLLGDHTLRSNRKFRRRGYDGGWFDTYTLEGRKFKTPLKGDYVYPVYSIYSRGDSPLICEPSDVEGHVVRGTRGYTKLSIYTLARHITCRYESNGFKF